MQPSAQTFNKVLQIERKRKKRKCTSRSRWGSEPRFYRVVVKCANHQTVLHAWSGSFRDKQMWKGSSSSSWVCWGGPGWSSDVGRASTYNIWEVAWLTMLNVRGWNDFHVCRCADHSCWLLLSWPFMLVVEKWVWDWNGSVAPKRYILMVLSFYLILTISHIFACPRAI